MMQIMSAPSPEGGEMPMFLGMTPFAPLAMQPMPPVAMGSLMGHLIYGLILGGSNLAIAKKGGGRISFKERRLA